MEDIQPLQQAEQALLKQLEAAQQTVVNLQEMIDGIRKLQNRTPTKSTKTPIVRTASTRGPKVRPLEYPTTYNKNLTLYQKVFIAIKNIKSGTVDEVAESLRKLDPKEYRDSKYTRKAAANGLFQLFSKQNKIKAEQKGVKYIYSI